MSAALSLGATAPPATPRLDAAEARACFDGLVAEAMEKRPVPGLAVVVVKDGEILFSAGYGVADLERRRPVIPDRTLFRLGSVTKPFTATAVLQLAERGALDLDADVNLRLTRFKVDGSFPRPVTAASLLCLWPGDRLGVFVAHNGDRQDTSWFLLDAFLSRFFPADPPPRFPPADFRTRYAGLEGSYTFLRHARTTIEKLALLRRPDVVVTVLPTGTLDVGGTRFTEIEPGLFEQAGSWERLAFDTDARGVATHLFVDQDVLERVPWASTSGVQGLLFAAYALVFLSSLLRWGSGPLLWRADATEPPPDKGAARALALARSISVAYLLFLAGLVLALRLTARGEIWQGVPWPLYGLLSVPLAAGAASLALPIGVGRAYRRGWWNAAARARYAATAAAQLSFVAFLNHWNLLGFRF